MQGHDNVYDVSLLKCDCVDFQRRQLPCKHMYRLAMELGLIKETALSYTHGGYSWKQAVEIVEHYPEDVQRSFFDVFAATKQKSEPVRKKKSDALSILISDGLLVLFRETAQFYTVRPIEDFFMEKQTVYSYFSSKFHLLSYFDGDHDVVMPLPDNGVTVSLSERGFSPESTKESPFCRKYSLLLSLLFDAFLILIGIMLCNASVVIGLIVIVYAFYNAVKCFKPNKKSNAK